MTGDETFKPPKAYKNLAFLNSPDARTIRVLAEFLEPAARFDEHRIRDTIVFFGSSRIRDPETAKEHLEKLTRTYPREEQSEAQKKEVHRARIAMEMSRYYEDAVELARLLTEWSLSLGRGQRRLIVCSGGGPGIMEAANKGATLNKKGYSIGLNISIPFEQFANPYITKELNFEFHYFFIRKYWFLYLAKALVAFPGGFGTLDELFEVLTLIQTKKITKKLPVVMYGSEFWKKALDIEFLVERGMIEEDDVNLFHMSDDPYEAFEFLKETLTKAYLEKPQQNSGRNGNRARNSKNRAGLNGPGSQPGADRR